MKQKEAVIFDIKRDCSEDGPGIRTTVFFKGCPLNCTWCHNPEGKKLKLGLSFIKKSCTPDSCGTHCVEVCPNDTLKMVDGALKIDFGLCIRCDKCFDVCPRDALEPSGFSITLDDLLQRVLIDRPFFEASGGGVTLSGGEATMHMDFISDFLQELKKGGIHTALETCGMFNFERFKDMVLPHLDLLFYDFKLIKDHDSRRYTGGSSQRILSNFTKVMKATEITVIPRVPLIPGITTNKDNLAGIAEFLKRHGIDYCSLMEYNPMWKTKAEQIGAELEYHNFKFMTEEEEDEAVESFFGGIRDQNESVS